MDWEEFYNNFRRPDFIPGYEIQNRLGGGAFGDVYKARKHSIGKAYAIKFLKVEGDSQREAVERELAQVRHFASIDHPNLVTIEDMGTAMGVPFLIMGYAGEDTLARRLEKGPLGRDQALSNFVQVCRGVLALHDRRLVHFDLKPSNVFLKGEVARVGDYGLSKLLSDGRMTLSFGRGTPQYMAPEMLRSRADHRADLYSLGVILYEALTGALPFKSQEPGGLVLREEDQPPDFPSSFPARLRPLVARCLRLMPEDRHPGVGALLEELGQTARQGDSVVFDWSASPAASEAAPPAPPAPPATAATAATAAAPTPTEVQPGPVDPHDPEKDASSELRRTAADLTRGAVEVARGMWHGLRQSANREVAAGEETSASALATPADLEATTGFGQTPYDSIPETRVPAPRASGRRGMRDEARRRAQGLLVAVRGRREEGGVLSDPYAQQAFGLDRPAATIPVPPRAEGGPMGAVVSTGVVGMEVLGALVGGLARGAWRHFSRFGEGLLRASGGMGARTARLSLFLLGMALLGALVMGLGLVFVQIASE